MLRKNSNSHFSEIKLDVDIDNSSPTPKRSPHNAQILPKKMTHQRSLSVINSKNQSDGQRSPQKPIKPLKLKPSQIKKGPQNEVRFDKIELSGAKV